LLINFPQDQSAEDTKRGFGLAHLRQRMVPFRALEAGV
jgi:hypothetical protein